MLKKLAEDRGLKYDPVSNSVELADGSLITEVETGVFVKWFIYPNGWPSNSQDFDNFEAALNFDGPYAEVHEGAIRIPKKHS